MNSGTNNLLHTGYWRQHTRALYDDVSYDRIQVFSVSIVPGSTPTVVGPMGPGSLARAYELPPFGSARQVQNRRPASQPSFLNQPRDTNMPRDVYPRPRFTSQSPMTPDPILTGDVQSIGLEKLRNEVYNPRVHQVSPYNNDYDYSSRAKSQNHEDGKRCAVCLDDFKPREMVTLTPCHHMFHEKCIVPWVRSRGQCPVCRFVINDRTKKREGTRTIDSRVLDNDPFAREFLSFIRAREARG